MNVFDQSLLHFSSIHILACTVAQGEKGKQIQHGYFIKLLLTSQWLVCTAVHMMTYVMCCLDSLSPTTLVMEVLRTLCERTECAVECIYQIPVVETLLVPILALLKGKQVSKKETLLMVLSHLKVFDFIQYNWSVQINELHLKRNNLIEMSFWT